MTQLDGSHGRCVSHCEIPAMVLIETALTSDCLMLSAAGHSPIDIPPAMPAGDTVPY